MQAQLKTISQKAAHGSYTPQMQAKVAVLGNKMAERANAIGNIRERERSTSAPPDVQSRIDELTTVLQDPSISGIVSSVAPAVNLDVSSLSAEDRKRVKDNIKRISEGKSPYKIVSMDPRELWADKYADQIKAFQTKQAELDEADPMLHLEAQALKELAR